MDRVVYSIVDCHIFTTLDHFFPILQQLTSMGIEYHGQQDPIPDDLQVVPTILYDHRDRYMGTKACLGLLKDLHASKTPIAVTVFILKIKT